MSLREIDICLRRIEVRRHNTYAMRAALHGVKIPMKEASKHKPKLASDKNKEKASTAMQQALKNRNLKPKQGRK